MAELHLNPLRTKIIGKLFLTSESPLHIGAGGEEVRRTVLRLPDGRLIIPASTWKGSIRALAEKIAKTMTFKGITQVAVRLYSESANGISYIPSSGSPDIRLFDQVMSSILNSLLSKEPSEFVNTHTETSKLLTELGYEQEEIDELKNRGKEAPRRLAQKVTEAYVATQCPLGALFGNRELASKIRFTDSVLAIAKTESRPGVGIDRKSGRVRENALYFMETSPAKSIVKLTMIADNLVRGADDSLIMAATLEAIELIGLQIGGRKSAGLGNLAISGEDSNFYPIDLDHDDNGTLLANPFKNTQPLHLGDFIRWLRSNGGPYSRGD